MAIYDNIKKIFEKNDSFSRYIFFKKLNIAIDRFLDLEKNDFLNIQISEINKLLFILNCKYEDVFIIEQKETTDTEEFSYDESFSMEEIQSIISLAESPDYVNVKIASMYTNNQAWLVYSDINSSIKSKVTIKINKLSFSLLGEKNIDFQFDVPINNKDNEGYIFFSLLERQSVGQFANIFISNNLLEDIVDLYKAERSFIYLDSFIVAHFVYKKENDED